MKTENSANKILKEVWEWTYTIVIAVAIAFLIKAFLFDIVKVDGLSMHPTLDHGDRLIVTKLGYSPKQGDIIILDANYKTDRIITKMMQKQKAKKSLMLLKKEQDTFLFLKT